MKKPLITPLTIPLLQDATSKLLSTGNLEISGNFTYLNIQDEYIHDLFPLIQNQQVKKPDYFKKGGVGAHITVIYPEENKRINKQDLGKEYSFIIKDTVVAEIGKKKYYVLLVESPALLQLRRNHGLPCMLCFRGYAIGFHVTIGIIPPEPGEFNN